MNIVLSHVTARYPHSDAEVLKDISLKIPSGSSVSLIGANGCGKTTLLRVMLGLLPYEGELLLDGRDLKTYDRKELAASAALMTQLTDSAFPYTVYEAVLQGRFLRMKGLFRRESSDDRAAVMSILQKTGLEGLADRPVTELSGGQRQRVFLARTLVQDTPLLFLDEPTNHLDLKYQAELAEYLKDWKHSEEGTSRTLVSVFHDLSLALRISDYGIVLKEGRLLSSGPIRDILTPELLNQAFDFQVVPYLMEELALWREIL